MTIKDTLLNHFKTPIIPLDKVAVELFGFTKKQAKYFHRSDLFQYYAIQFDVDDLESPWLIYIDDLVDIIEHERSIARVGLFQYKRRRSEVVLGIK
jgi:hypothetical protein